MKRLFSLVLLVVAFASGLQAQTSSISYQANLLSEAGVDYFGLKGGSQYGLHISMFVPKGLGVNFNVRSSFKEHDGISGDLCVNYTYPLWQNSDVGVYGIAEAGPVLASYDKLDEDLDWEQAIRLDAVAGVGIGVAYSKFFAYAGYRYEFVKFKFDGDNRVGMFRIGIGYKFL